MTLDPHKIKKEFPCLLQSESGQDLVYLDSASTTQRPTQVLESINNFYRHQNANVHRALYQLGERATQAYEKARLKIRDFINAPHVLNSADVPQNIIFTSGTTEAINLVASSWGQENLCKGDEVILTQMEHHSQLVPWQLVAKRTGAKLRFIPVLKNGTLDLQAYKEMLSSKTKFVGCIHISNVLGTINPVKEIVRLAHEVGAITLIDGAQSVPHTPINVTDIDCDFFAFSGHKMMGPTGIGILYGKPEILDTMTPYQGGGDMIDFVTLEGTTWAELPAKFEAGTPNISGVIGLGAAVDYLQKIGMTHIQTYEKKLIEYTIQKLQELPDIKIYGDAPERSGVISFTIAQIHAHDITHFLSQKGICVRAGHHCAQPLMECLGITSTTRASFSIYNTTDDVDRLVEALKEVQAFFG